MHVGNDTLSNAACAVNALKETRDITPSLASRQETGSHQRDAENLCTRPRFLTGRRVASRRVVLLVPRHVVQWQLGLTPAGLSAAGEWALTRRIGGGLALHECKYKPANAEGAQYQRCLEDARLFLSFSLSHTHTHTHAHSLRRSFCKHVSGGRMPAHIHAQRGEDRERKTGGFDASAQCNVDIEHTRLVAQLRNAHRKTRLDNARVFSLIEFTLPP